MVKPLKKDRWKVIFAMILSICLLLIPKNQLIVKGNDRQFINRVGKAAVQMSLDTGFFASVAVAQAIVESGFGQSTLAHQQNNILGIKNTNGEYRSFNSYEEAMEYYGSIFTSTYAMRRHYRNFLNASTVDEAVNALVDTYAQDSQYASKLLTVIDRYNLRSFDQMVIDEQNRLEALRLAEIERQAKLAEEQRILAEKQRLESLKTVSLKHEEANERIIKPFEKYSLFFKSADMDSYEYDGYVYKLRINERTLLEKGE